MQPFSQIRSLRAFTLSELMVALTILGLTMTGVVAFTYQGLNVYYYDGGRLLVNRDIRKFTGEMTNNAVYSNYFQIYTSFTNRTLRVDGQSGDFLLLVYTDTSSTTGKTTVNRLLGYYRDPNSDTGVGPVRKFDVTVSPSVVIGGTTNTGTFPATYKMSDLLALYAPTSTAHTNSIVIQFAQGLSDGSLFYDFRDRSAIIKSQINEGGSLIKKAANTYNFTISPRG